MSKALSILSMLNEESDNKYIIAKARDVLNDIFELTTGQLDPGTENTLDRMFKNLKGSSDRTVALNARYELEDMYDKVAGVSRKAAELVDYMIKTLKTVS